MPTQRENEENNRLSKLRQERRREYNKDLSRLIPAKQKLQQLEDYKEGGVSDTKISRQLESRINELENAIKNAEDKLTKNFEGSLSKTNSLSLSKDQSQIQNQGLGQVPTFKERERAAGLFDTNIENKLNIPTFEEREQASGLFNANIENKLDIPTFQEREREAGLFDTDIGNKLNIPTFEERERNAGLTDTMLGRENTSNRSNQSNEQTAVISDEEDQMGTFGVIIAINGEPYAVSIYGQIAAKIEE